MNSDMLFSLAAILAIGIAGHWLAWFFRLPSILVLLISGLLLGPVFGVINPDELFGHTLFPVVSLSVGIILFDGGLSLKFKDLKQTGRAVYALSTIGLLTTWILSALLAYYILSFPLRLSLLIGAVLVVTGPTVIIPLLRQVRPIHKIATILRWEGIVTDPMGAILAILVYEAISGGGLYHLPEVAAMGTLRAIAIAGILAAVSAKLFIEAVRRALVPEFLENAIVLGLVLITFAISNAVQHESGLLTATLLGCILANQSSISIKRIVEFQENLRVLLLALLFITLAARLDFSGLSGSYLPTALFLAGLIIIARPAAVIASTITNKNLNWNERAYLACMAPRGIVAAAVSSLFTVKLGQLGEPEADRFAAVIFLVIITTVAFYGILARPLARLFKVANTGAKGFLLVGANSVSQSLALKLQELGAAVILVDSNRRAIRQAERLGCNAVQGNILDEALIEELNLDNISYLLAMTSNDEINTLAALHFRSLFGANRVFKVRPGTASIGGSDRSVHSKEVKLLFDESLGYDQLEEAFDKGASIEVLEATPAQKGKEGQESAPDSSQQVLFLVSKTGGIQPFNPSVKSALAPAAKVAILVPPSK